MGRRTGRRRRRFARASRSLLFFPEASSVQVHRTAEGQPSRHTGGRAALACARRAAQRGRAATCRHAFGDGDGGQANRSFVLLARNLAYRARVIQAFFKR